MRRFAPLLSLALLLAGCGAHATPAVKSSAPPPPQQTAPPPKTTPSPKPPTHPPSTLHSAVAVTIDNAPGAWPQSGLTHADLVFEFLAEGGITRYLAVFFHQSAPKIGPVRSTRIYFDDVAAAYGWPLAHAGGNVDALQAIPKLSIKNLDQIYGSGAYFWRASDRQMPHNLYTSTDLLEKGIQADNYAPVGLAPLPGGTLAGKGTSSVEITYADYPNSWVYRVGWIYQDGTYLREIDGKGDRTQDGNAVRAANVVIVYVPEFSDPDPYTVGAVNFTLRGGRGWMLENGVRAPIEWTFSNGFHFTLPGGPIVPFAKGQTWIEVVPTNTPVQFTPQT